VPIVQAPRQRIRFPPERIPRIRISYEKGGISETQSVEMGNLLRESFILDSGSSDAQRETQKMVEVTGVDQERDKTKWLHFNNEYDKKKSGTGY